MTTLYHTYYVGVKFLWPLKRTMEPKLCLSSSAKEACDAAIKRLNKRMMETGCPVYKAISRESVNGRSIYQVRLSMGGQPSVIIVAALAAGVPDVIVKE